MTKEEYVNKILELTKEILIFGEPTIEDLKKMYLEIKVKYEIMKEVIKTEGEDNDS